jgi:hypothetical protein
MKDDLGPHSPPHFQQTVTVVHAVGKGKEEYIDLDLLE